MSAGQHIEKKMHTDARALGAWLDDARKAGKNIVFTNGCFDILHRGHITYLCQAKDLGQVLVIGVNDDASVHRLKGEGRPVHPLQDRMHMLAALSCVDAVVPFSEDTPYNLINFVRPDVLVKGGDYKAGEVVGGDIVNANGGRVEILDFVQGYSTTDILEKLGDK